MITQQTKVFENLSIVYIKSALTEHAKLHINYPRL